MILSINIDIKLTRAEGSSGAYRIGNCSLPSSSHVCRRLATLSNDISSESTESIGPKFYL